MSKVVYLLGAGASYGIRKDSDVLTMDDVSLIREGLPIVSEINNEIKFVIGWLESVVVPNGEYSLMGKKCEVDELKEELINGFEWMLKESSRHATIDTFAKKLYLKDDKKYGQLKFLLSTFFMIEQILHPYDKRYDAFLANILNSDLTIPNNIFVMTWNYDVQLDIAYRDYNNVCGLPMCVPLEEGNTNEKVKVYKINGSANYYCKNQLDSSYFFDNNHDALLKAIFEQLSLTTQNGRYSDGTTDLLFAWENNEFHKRSDFLSDIISDAQILVVIGYTFPFFNREIDREIFSKMPYLKKIYIQDPKPDKVKLSLKSILSMEQFSSMISNLEVIDDMSNFFLPPEL